MREFRCVPPPGQLLSSWQRRFLREEKMCRRRPAAPRPGYMHSTSRAARATATALTAKAVVAAAVPAASKGTAVLQSLCGAHEI